MPDPKPLAELTRTQAAIRRGMAEGLHTGAQLFASIAGQPVADLAMGDSREATIGQPAVAMTTDTVVLWLSSTKPVVAAVVMQLVENGSLELDRPVADWIPAFAAGGKESITIRHLLTHAGGFRYVDVGWPETSWDEIIARISAVKVERDWVVGEKAGYHPFTSWYILGELVRIAAQQPLPLYVRQHVLDAARHDRLLDRHAARAVACVRHAHRQADRYRAAAARAVSLCQRAGAPPIAFRAATALARRASWPDFTKCCWAVASGKACASFRPNRSG